MARNPVQRRSIRRRVLLWLLGSLFGALVIALPDDGPRLFSLSASHGPSAVDLLGIAIMIAAWLPVVLLLWTNRAALRGGWAAAAGLLGGIGALMLSIAIAVDAGSEWMIGASLLIVAQLLAVAVIGTARRNGSARPSK